MTTERQVIPIKAILNERLWVKATKPLVAKAKDLFTHMQYEEQQCDKCEYRPDRHCEVCDECPAFLGQVSLWKRELKGPNEISWIGVPIGNRKKLKKWTEGYKLDIHDFRTNVSMRSKLKFTGTPHAFQDKAVIALIAAGYGVLEAPPRSGKTVMAVDLSCRLRKKTLILASQHDWLEQFLDTYHTMTNCLALEERLGRKVVDICTDPKKMANLDVCLATYQSFMDIKGRDGKRRMRAIKRMFSIVIVDEVHKASSTHFARVLSMLNAWRKFGLTGTYDRKDGSHVITNDIMGPITVSTSVGTLVPTVQLIVTPASTTYNYKVWTYAMRYLANHKERNELIVKHAIKDIKAGRSIVIPVGVVQHAIDLVEAINLHFGREVAVAFTSKTASNKTRRKQILEDARSYKIKCIVGTRQLVQTGINIPRWDTLYEVCPISNPPNMQQETSRIRTDVPGKKPPLIKHFIEDFGPSKGCFRTCYFQTYLKMKFLMTEDTKALAMKYVSNSKRKTSGSNFGVV